MFRKYDIYLYNCIENLTPNTSERLEFKILFTMEGILATIKIRRTIVCKD